MRLLPLPLLILFPFALFGCSGPDDPPTDDLCVGGDTPSATLGRGVGSAFLEYEDNEEVGLAVAPQGGFGVTVIVRTAGLEAGVGLVANVQLNVEDGSSQVVGEFLQENTALACRDADIGGEIRGVVVGFDPAVYKTNDDLLALDGQSVNLVVTVNDDNGRSATVRKPVIIRVGGS